jgi:hypothetical protein
MTAIRLHMLPRQSQFFFCILFICTSLFAGAQEFQGGMRFGMTATQVDGDRLEGFDKAGLLAGLTLSRELSERTSLGMEMFFIQKGSFKPVSKVDNSYYRMRLSYIEVPLLLRWKAVKKLELEAGPAFGVLVASQEKDQIGLISYAPPFERMEYSVNAGIRYALSDEWLFNARYSCSVVPIRPFEGANGYFYWDRGQFNRVLQLSFGFTF